MIFRPILAACLILAFAPHALAQTQAPAKKTHTRSHAKSAPKSTPKTAPKKEEAPSPAAGSAPRLVAQYGDWGVYVSNAKGKICYALSEPKSRAPKLDRDPAYLFVSTRPAENVRNEISVVVGFAIKEGSDGSFEVGSQRYPLYTKNDSAWLKNAAEEPKLVESLRKHGDLMVKTTPAKGGITTDRYSLNGVSQALDRVAQECK